MTSFCVMLLLLAAATADPVFRPRSGGEGKTMGFTISSGHIPIYVTPMNLTTGELKLFAGHSIQFIKSKCPAVSKESLNAIQKYISKLISKTNPVPDKSPTFEKLLTSISSCAMRDSTRVKSKDEDGNSPSFFSSFMIPFSNVKGSLSGDGKSKSTTEDTDAASTTSNPSDVNQIAAATRKDGVNTAAELNKQDDSESDEMQDDSTTMSSADETTTQQTNFFVPYHQMIHGSSNSADSWNPIAWLQHIMHVVHDYFSKIFGPENVTISGATATFRAKREVSDSETDDDEHDDHDEHRDDGEGESNDDVVKPSKVVVDVVEGFRGNNGKQQFLQLMDNLCRLYCAECTDSAQISQIMNVKAAAKALLKFVYLDTTGVELLAKKFLDSNFLQSLEDC